MNAADKSRIRDAANRSPVGRYIYAGKLDGIPDLRAPPAITESQARAICREFQFSTEKHLSDLVRQLNCAAQNYWAKCLAQLRQPKSKAVKVEIKNISELSNSLLAALSALSPQAARVFWQPEQVIESRPWHGTVDPALDASTIQESQSPFGHTLISVRAADASVFKYRINEEYHFESLKILSAYSEHALKHFNSRRAGRPRSEALHLLVSFNVNFWREVLGREFYVDHKNGEAANTSTHFAVKLAQIVDPGVPEKQVITVARRIVMNRHTLPAIKNMVGN